MNFRINFSFTLIIGILISATIAFFWGSSLSFFPVPWPDDSAFYLPAVEWLSSPWHYHMHAQAAFVPTYDQANFNTMPFLPLLLGLGRFLGIDSVHEIRIYGMLIFGAWVFLLGLWMQKRGSHPLWIILISGCALFSPTIRWGAMLVRPEIWQGFFWLLILMEMDGFWKNENPWRLPLFLALAAYVHFEAYIWILPVGFYLIFNRAQIKPWPAILSVFWRTFLLLTPWLVYVLINWDVFWTQMQTQFGRLHSTNHYMSDWYGVFHHLFISNASPMNYPKFYNVGKGLTWLLFFVALSSVFWNRNKLKLGIYLAAPLAFLMAFHLWYSKPETWFTTLIHLSFWPLLVLALPHGFEKKKLSHLAFSSALGLLFLFEAGVAIEQFRKTSGIYSWNTYTQWINCIEKQVGDRKEIWQPTYPDVLVELARRDPKRSYTRAVDFPNIEPLIEKHVQKVDVIIHSLFLDLDQKEIKEFYEGFPRPFDLYYITDYPWMAFKEHNATKMGLDWSLYTCHSGPFLAVLSLKQKRP